jgi:hypothetical protein
MPFNGKLVFGAAEAVAFQGGSVLGVRGLRPWRPSVGSRVWKIGRDFVA